MYCFPKYKDLNHLTFLQGAWKPSLNISTVLTSIQLLMAEPNPDDPLMADIVSHTFTFTYPSKQKYLHTVYLTITCLQPLDVEMTANIINVSNNRQPGILFSVTCIWSSLPCISVDIVHFSNTLYLKNLTWQFQSLFKHGIIKKNTPHCDYKRT